MSDRNILFIGNGFDLYHDLPTRYTDFLEFAQNWDVFYTSYIKNIKNSSGINAELFSVRLDNHGKLCKETLKDFASYAPVYNPENIDYLNRHLSSNAWLNFFIKCDYKKEGWIDFEKVMKDVLFAVDKYLPMGITGKRIDHKGMKNIDRLAIETLIIPSECKLIIAAEGNNYYMTCTAGEDILAKAKKTVLDYLKKAMQELSECLRIYLFEFIQHIEIKKHSNQIENLRNVSLLSVNYTNTYEKAYADDILQAKHFVHGDILHSPNNIVLGFDPSGLESLDYVFFYKYFQRIQKRTGADYKKWLDVGGYISGSLDVHIFGHSLDITDRDILEDLISNHDNAIDTVHIYYHSQSAYESQVINLINIFGRDAVIDYVGSGYIVFEEIE